jgi:hypothetical protein
MRPFPYAPKASVPVLFTIVATAPMRHFRPEWRPILLFVPLRIERKSPARGAFAVSEYGRHEAEESLSRFSLFVF